MQTRTITRLIGLLLMIFSLTMLTPLIVNFLYHDGEYKPFIQSFFVTFLTGFILWLGCYNQNNELKTRDGFLIVALFWIVLCAFSSLPLMLSPYPHSSITDSIFESVSGFTTSGASVIPRIAQLPHDILFYRQQLQFLGGMGIIVLAIAILPMLGVGGMQLYRAETPGPLKDAKLTPRITESAKALWLIYLMLTLICALCFWLAGMDGFDALGESFATISTGGFAMHDTSFAFYQNNTISLIASFFMVLGGINFSLHFVAFRQHNIKHYWQDEEFRWYIYLLLTGIALTCTSLIIHNAFANNTDAIVNSIFNVVSLTTTTGFTSAPFGEWPDFVPLLLMLLAIAGGCAASTSGGIKIIRFLLLFKQGAREIERLVHPNAIYNIKFANKTLPRHILQAMWGFISIFIALYLVILLLLLAFGNDLLTSVGATTASLANAGAGLGKVSSNFATLNLPSKWLLMFAMLAGRLEIFSLLVLFSPSFWHK